MKRNAPGQRGLLQKLILAPYSVWAALFIVVPLGFVAYYAFTDSNFNFTLDNITRFFTATSTVTEGEISREVHTYLLIFARSLKLAVISTFICLLMGVGDALVTFVNMEQMMFFYRLYYADWYLALYMLVNGLVYSSIGAWLGAKTGSKLQQVMGE